MITIIAGKTNEGKTSKMLDIYQNNPKGDGFACIKVFKNNKFIGFNFLRLSNKAQIPFMIKSDCYNDEVGFDKTCFNFHYDEKALEHVKNVIDVLIDKKVEPIYLDEIGRLEIQGLGHDQALKDILQSNLDAIICVRETFINDIIAHYNISNYRIVGVNQNE